MGSKSLISNPFDTHQILVTLVCREEPTRKLSWKSGVESNSAVREAPKRTWQHICGT